MDFRKFSQSLRETEASFCFCPALGERENVQLLWWVNKKIIEGVQGSWHTLVL